MKLIVFLTDGQGAYDEKYEQMATERGVKIYTVGLGKSYDESLLKKIAGNTGGKHYHVNHADDLIEEFRQLTRDTIDIVTDSDSDGLSDYHEERIRLFNGSIIKLDKTKPDTDGDGLKDGEEITQRTDKQGRVYFSLYAYPNSIDSDNDRINDKEDELPLVPYTIDYLGSLVHLKSVKDRVLKIKNERAIVVANVNIKYPPDSELASYESEFMINDYEKFLEERGVDTEGKHREEYWQKDWDKYWEDYCNAMNSCIRTKGSVTKKEHYFRNNLNRIPETLDDMVELNSLTEDEIARINQLEQESKGITVDASNDVTLEDIARKENDIKHERDSEKWHLLAPLASTYHMHNTDFCDNGLYNLKFLSPDGKYEGVYTNAGGEYQGKACTDETDSINMGTYNYDGRYIDNIVYVLGHKLLDMNPYDKWCNVSPEDKKEPRDIDEYNENQSAVDARSKFQKGWYGR